MDHTPENIPAPALKNRDDFELLRWLETYMKKIGRKSRAGRAMTDRSDIPERPDHPLYNYVQKKWKFLSRTIENLPNAPGVRWHAVVNNIPAKWPYAHEVPNGNSYFSARKL